MRSLTIKMKRRRTYSSDEPPRQRAKLTKEQRSQVMRLVTRPMELHHWPVYSQAFAISTTHTVFDLMAIAQGDGVRDRSGNQVTVQSLRMDGIIVGSDASNVMRLTLVRWKPSSVPTAADVYDNTVIGANGAMFSGFNIKERQDFAVLYDKWFNLEQTATGNHNKLFSIKVGAQPKATFRDTLTTTCTNKLYLIASSDSNAVSHPDLTFRGDLRYYDA